VIRIAGKPRRRQPELRKKQIGTPSNWLTMDGKPALATSLEEFARLRKPWPRHVVMGNSKGLPIKVFFADRRKKQK